MSKHGYTIDEIEELGIEDGDFDNDNHMPYRSSYGSSIDVDDLEDEEREAYDRGYHDSIEDFDPYSDHDDDYDDYDNDNEEEEDW
jgi:hypothetical protein